MSRHEHPNLYVARLLTVSAVVTSLGMWATSEFLAWWLR